MFGKASGNKLLTKSYPHSGKSNRNTLKGALLLILACLITALVATSAFASVDTKRAELNRKRESLRTTRKNLDISKTRHQDISMQLLRTKSQIKTVNREIKQINHEIVLSQEDIKRLRQEMDKLVERHTRRQKMLQARLVDIYFNTDNMLIDALANSENFADFVTYTDYLGRLCESDEREVKSLRLEHDAIQFKKQQIDNKYKRMLSYRGRLKQKTETLKNIEEKRSELLEESRRDFQYYFERKCELENHTAELESDIQRMLRSYQQRHNTHRGGSYTPPKSTGQYQYPVNGIVTSGYGYRVHPIFGNTRFHTGVDFGAPTGTPIFAADGGTVCYSGWCGGYGNTVMIDHGRGYVTLYAHCSQLYVRNGQSVSRGDTIAAVGSTGYSTGPHLHFEVRYNGEPVDPFGFIR